MNIGQILQNAKNNMKRQEEALAAELLLSFLLNKKKEYLFLNPSEEIHQEQEKNFQALFKRFYQGEPLAYLTHHKEFFGLDFHVDKRVLIPRPETELLVEKVLELTKKTGDVRILDIGTGSGCIALSLAKNLPGAQITASDISTEALQVAALNRETHGLKDRVTLIESNLLQNIEEPFDIIVANLPYIGEKKFNFVAREVYKYEPHIALFGGDDGTFLYEQLFQQLKAKKWQPHFLLGEFGFLQGEKIRGLHAQYFPDEQLEIFQDYAKIERIFMILFET
jgi:release factor glutamine methyltransferase